MPSLEPKISLISATTGKLEAEHINSQYRLVFSGKDFLIIDKPAGSNVHRNHHESSLVDCIKADLGLNALHLVHRLDDDTSGLLILAKHGQAAAEFGRLFEQRQVDKFYLALASGKPSKKQGAVTGDLEKTRGGNYRLSRNSTNPSRTHFFSYALLPGKRLYLLKPYTGKTHQLRVVMKSLGVPILGDRRYGPSTTDSDRMYLHAYALAFSYQGERYQFICPPEQGQAFHDGGFVRALLNLPPPWSMLWPKR